MNDPTRFSETDPESPEATLLRSMRKDAAPEASKKALLGVLGLGVAFGVSGTAAAAGGGSGIFGFGTAKWLAIVGIGGAVLAVGYGVRTASRSEPPPIVARDIGLPMAATQRPPPPVAEPTSPSPPTELPALVQGAGGPVSSAAIGLSSTKTPAARDSQRANPPASNSSGLTDEVAALERARRALGDEDGASALRALSEYDQKFKNRTLGPEAEVLRIEALVRSGKRQDAEALARRFLAKNPGSPLASRVRSLLAQAKKSQ